MRQDNLESIRVFVHIGHGICSTAKKISHGPPECQAKGDQGDSRQGVEGVCYPNEGSECSVLEYSQIKEKNRRLGCCETTDVEKVKGKDLLWWHCQQVSECELVQVPLGPETGHPW